MHERLQIIEDIVIKKFPHGNTRTITDILNRNDVWIFAFRIQNAVDRGGGETAMIRQRADGDVTLRAEQLDTIPRNVIPCLFIVRDSVCIIK